MTMKGIAALSAKIRTIERNEFIKMQGSIDRNIYFIEEGAVRIFVQDPTGEQVIRLGYKDNLIVALDSFLTGRNSELCIQALKKTVVRVVSKAQLDQFLEIEGNGLVWQHILEDLLVQQLEREFDILTTSPKERYERVLKRSPALFQEIPNRHIANYLRMTPETLSRLKKS